jgi:hypothetical protein
MHGWIGRKDRRSIAASAVVRREDGSEMHVKLTDFSDEGCRIETEDDGLRIGEWVEISISSAGEVKAQVRWALGTSAGVKFENAEQS